MQVRSIGLDKATLQEEIYVRVDDISQNSDDIIARYLERNSFVYLKLKDVKDEIAKQYINSLKNNQFLTEIQLYHLNSPMIKYVADAFKTRPNINFFTIRNSEDLNQDNNIKYILDLIKTNESITYLTLDDNGLTNNTLQHIAEFIKTNTSLISLNLGCNSFTAEEVKLISDALNSNKKIKYLNLEGLNQSCELIVDMIKQNCLKGLNFNDTLFTESGCEKIVDALKENNSLESLSLAGNIKEEGVLKILNSLQSNHTLRCLDLSAYKKQEKTDIPISAKLLNWIGLSPPSPIIDILQKNHTLERFYLSGQPFLNHNTFIAIKRILARNSGEQRMQNSSHVNFHLD